MIRACALAALMVVVVSAVNPIVILPGLMGSGLEAERVNANGIPWPCEKNDDWEKVWADVEGMTVDYPCWKYVMQLQVDSMGVSSSFPGITVRNPLNSTYAVACLDPANSITCLASMYLGNWFNFMKTKGYTLQHDLDAVPFDFRLSPLNHYQPGGFFSRLKTRIETMYAQTGNTKVALLGHSMGGAWAALFMNTYVNATWKATYLARYVSIAGVYSGAPKAMKAVLVGDTEGVPFPSELIQEIIATWAGVMSLMPSNNNVTSIWTQPLITLSGQNYYAKDIPTFMHMMGFSNFADIVDIVRNVNMASAPGIETHCMMSKGISTIMALSFKSLSGSDRWNPTFTMGDGDGTVPFISLSVCSGWSGKQSQPVTTQLFSSEHLAIISSDQSAWNYILQTVNP
eukprot:PhF_6_TR30758/c0_g1_i1/m.45298/K06129/LYPLA3; lysophospholipase III